MTARLAAAALAFCLGPSATARGEVSLRAVDDGVRVDPHRCVLLESRGRAGPVVLGPGYLDDNPVHDRARGSVELQAARNETVAFQLVVTGPEGGLDEPEVSISDLSGPALLARGREVRLYRELHVRLDRPSSHEVAREAQGLLEAWFPISRYAPRYLTSLGPGSYPDALVPLDGPEAARMTSGARGGRARCPAFWVDLYVPRDAPEGRYEGEVEVEAAGRVLRMPVSLEVLPVTLPDEHHAGIGSVSYDFVGVTMAGLGAEAFHRLFREMHRHRMTLDPLYLHPEWNGGRIDWSGYDALVGPLLDGSAFDARTGYLGPGQGRPVRRFVLPVDWNWPLRPEQEGHGQAFRSALRRAEAHLVAGRPAATCWSVFINSTDEPRTEEAFAEIRRYGELLAASGVSRERIRYRIDAGPFKSIGDELPGWSLARVFDELGPYVDIWNCSGGVGSVPASALAARLRAHPDEEAWVYFAAAAGEPAMGSVLIDGEALGPRTWGWIAWRYGLSAVVAWEVGWPDPGCLGRPACSGYGLHGDASLVYLADSLGAPGEVLTSIRLKNLRRGAEDFEYLWLLREAGLGELADGYARRLVPAALDDGLVEGMPGAWEHDPAEWERVRREMGLVLAGRLAPPEPAAVLRGAPTVVLPPMGVRRRLSLVFAAFLVVLLVLFAAWPSGRGPRRPQGRGAAVRGGRARRARPAPCRTRTSRRAREAGRASARRRRSAGGRAGRAA